MWQSSSADRNANGLWLGGAALLATWVVACGGPPALSGTLGPRAGYALSRGTSYSGSEGILHVGPGADLRLYPSPDHHGFWRGFALGLEESWMPAWTRSAEGRRTNVLVGWGSVPRRPKHLWGGELTLPIGVATARVDDEVISTFDFGLRLTGLLKVPCWSDECTSALVAGRTFLVAELGWTGLQPLEGEGTALQGELTGMLGARYDISLLP